MKLEYKLARLAELDTKTLKDCDDGAKAMRDILVRTAWLIHKPITPIIWILTRFYKRKITKESISYDFYLIKG